MEPSRSCSLASSIVTASQNADDRDTEPRWPAVLAFVSVFAFVQLLPNRYVPLPPWLAWTLCGVGIASMAAVAVAPASSRRRRVERVTIIGIFAVVFGAMILGIIRLIADMLASKHGYGSITLLESAVETWTVNVLIFALLYWQLDRYRRKISAPDFQFAETSDVGRSHGWEPYFVDYLFVAFATSTSFTPPDYARPASRRAKLLLMAQASVSLTTLVLIASRAISTL